MQWKEQQIQHKALQPNDYVDEGYVCTQVDGSLIKPNYVSQHFKLFLEKHDMPHIRFHDLRHSSAGYLKYLGFDLKDIQVWLRHTDIQTTANFYLSHGMEAKQGIADRLEEKFKNMSAFEMVDKMVDKGQKEGKKRQKRVFRLLRKPAF
jgi:integrase